MCYLGLFLLIKTRNNLLRASILTIEIRYEKAAFISFHDHSQHVFFKKKNRVEKKKKKAALHFARLCNLII